MNQDSKYQPEDIEFILLNCDYEDLDTEQMAFVSEMIESKEEYMLMRRTLINIAEVAPNKVDIVPPFSIKNKLMSEFERGGSRRLTWWPNFVGTLFPREKRFTAKPGIQMAFTISVLVLIIVVIPWKELNQEQSDLALQEIDLEEKEPSLEPAEAILEKSKEELMSNENNLWTVQDSIATFRSTSDLNQQHLNSVISDELADSEEENVHVFETSGEILDGIILKDEVPIVYKKRSPSLKGELANPDNKKEASVMDGAEERNSFGGQISTDNEANDDRVGLTIGANENLEKAFENSDLSGASISPAISEDVILSESVSNSNKERKSSAQSRSLKADKELIELLFTAM